MLAHGSLMGHQGENSPNGLPQTSAGVSHCRGSLPCALILRNAGLDVNAWPLLRVLRSDPEAEGDSTPTWSSERKAYVICVKSLVKNEFSLSCLLWGEKNIEEPLASVTLPCPE